MTGKITLKGEPLGGATIGFNAIGSGIPVEFRYIAGTTDKFGNYAIDKVYPSEYMVTVNKLAETASEGEAVSANPSIKELAAYSGSSPLRANVTDAETVFNFDVK